MLCATDQPANKKPVEIENPDHPPGLQPVERQKEEPPQIKGPVELPERKKVEEVQLDRPDAGKETKPNLECYLELELCRISFVCFSTGVVVPEEEAHRHEPPIPHDEVKVDLRKNDAELEEDKKQAVPPAGGVDEVPKRNEERDLGNALKVDDQNDVKVEKKPADAVVGKEEVDLGGGEVLSNEALENPIAEAGRKEDAPLKDVENLNPVKDPVAENAAAGANQAAVPQIDKVAKAPDAAGKREFLKLGNFSVRQLFYLSAEMT